MSAAAPVLATLVTGAPGAREAAIAARLDPGLRSAVILEGGLADGRAILVPSDMLAVHRIASACLCCTGNLVLRVTLNRLLRQRPARLFIGTAAGDHLDQLRSWLCERPYDQLLELTPDIST